MAPTAILPTPGALRRASTASSLWSFIAPTTGFGICPSCHWKHTRLNVTLRFSSRHPLYSNLIICDRCNEIIFAIGTKRPLFAQGTLVHALTPSAQVFGAVGHPAIDLSEAGGQRNNVLQGSAAATAPKNQQGTVKKLPGKRSSSRPIRKHWKRAIENLPDSLKHLLSRSRNESSTGPEQQEPLQQEALPQLCKDTGVQTPDATTRPVLDRSFPTIEELPVDEMAVLVSLLPARRYSEAPIIRQPKAPWHRCDCAAQDHRCDCNSSCPCSKLENQPSIRSDGLGPSDDRPPSSQDTGTVSTRSSDPGPQRPTSKHPEDLIGLGGGFEGRANSSGQLDVPSSADRNNSLSGSTDIGDGNSNNSLTPPSLSQELGNMVRPHLRELVTQNGGIPRFVEIEQVSERQNAVRRGDNNSNQDVEEEILTNGYHSA